MTAPAPVSRVSFVSLGCPKNLVDSEKMLGVLKGSGFELVSEDAHPDAIVVNTCGFLEASKDESLEVIHDAIARKARGEIKRVIVAGCLVQRHRAKLLDWAPGIDAMVGVFDRDHIVEAVAGESRAQVAEKAPKYWIAANALTAASERGVSTVGLTVNGADGKGVGYFEDDSDRVRLTPRHWAYLRMSEGCNQRCAFCTIPSIRGKMRSKPLDRIAAEARGLMASGAFELNLIGQDTTSYGMDIGEASGLPGLLKTVDGVAREFGGGWMRLMYAYPSKFDDASIDALARYDNIVKYIDMPLQHASDAMLASMRRHTTRAHTEALLEKLRERVAGIAIRTTFIVGHPGETEDDFEQLLEFINEQQFDMMGVFRYSAEEGTPSGTMEKDPTLAVPDAVKREREERIMLLQQEIAYDNAKLQAKSKAQFDVLIEAPSPSKLKSKATTGVGKGGALYTARAYFQAPSIDSTTFVQSNQPRSAGELVRCTIVDANGYDLIAVPTEELEKKISLPIMHRH